MTNACGALVRASRVDFLSVQYEVLVFGGRASAEVFFHFFVTSVVT